MAEKKDIREKTRKIYDVLPELDDQRCEHRTCGEFARAVVEGRAPCYGCVSGGPQVAREVCEIMGARVPEVAIPQSGFGSGFYWRRFPRGSGVGGGIGQRMGRGLGGGRGMGQGRGMGRGGGMGRGFGRGRRGR